MERPTIRTRERGAIVRALSAGVVPRVGLQHIQVGRSREIEELLGDIDRISEGGSTIRFIIGEYGSGKTFFLNLVRQIAMEKRMVVLSADISPDRRLHATGGQARSLYAEMARNTSTLTRQDGGAMPSVVERFATEAMGAAEKTGESPTSVIRRKLAHLEEMVGGYDFATVVSRYWEGYDTDNEELKSSALRWLRGEYSTRTDARRDLGVRTIVDDAALYDQLKLMAAFTREAGYQGVVVSLDEMVNLYKLVSSQARQSNYEQILRILNDVLQGTAEHIGFLMGGTPEFLMDTRRGLYSYAALQSRLSENSFARDGMVDCLGAGHTPRQPHSRGHVRVAVQHPAGDAGRRKRAAGRGTHSFHGPLFNQNRGRLLPDPQEHGQGICEHAGNLGAESRSRLAGPGGVPGTGGRLRPVC